MASKRKRNSLHSPVVPADHGSVHHSIARRETRSQRKTMQAPATLTERTGGGRVLRSHIKAMSTAHLSSPKKSLTDCSTNEMRQHCTDDMIPTLTKKHRSQPVESINMSGLCPDKFTAADKTLIASTSHQSETKISNPGGSIDQASHLGSTHVQSQSADEKKTGFLDLPVELRDMIYAEVFVFKHDGDIAISPFSDRPIGVSPNFLRTCKQIQREGCKWLYSKNRFHFTRDWREVGGHFDCKWNELGYETSRLWIETIGEVNMGTIERILLTLDDASKSKRPRATIGERRYYNDPELATILTYLAKHDAFKHVIVCFSGRQKLDGHGEERQFFGLLQRIKTEDLALRGQYHGEIKTISLELQMECYREMQTQWDVKSEYGYMWDD